jgi:hypothetical protein
MSKKSYRFTTRDVYVKFEDYDRGFKRLQRMVRSKPPVARVGIMSPEARKRYPGHNGESPKSLIEVAAIQEFGTSKVPRRSFLRDTFDMHRKTLETDMAHAIAKGFRSGNVKGALESVAHKFKTLMITRIRSKIPPPNAPKTIGIKGSSIPLIDSGTLVKSIKVVMHQPRTRKKKAEG